VLAVCYVNAPVLTAARVHTFRRADIRLASGLWALDIEEALSTNLGLTSCYFAILISARIVPGAGEICLCSNYGWLQGARSRDEADG
jgi:hypothetical protein